MAEPSQASASAAALRNWHRLFGLLLADYLTGSPFTVELEVDLSKKQQLLDVVIVRRDPGPMCRPLPDGLNDLVAHNLITFKSHHEPLDDWTLKELTGHYVAYRKQISPRGNLMSEDHFRLFAVSARRPRDLFAAVPPEPVQAGVYTCRRGSDAIRIVVANELPNEERNALLHLFSAAPEKVQYGQEHYQVQSPDISSIIGDLFGSYHVEGLPMPYTIEDYRREKALEYIQELTTEERAKLLPLQELLRDLPLEQRLAGLAREEIEAYLKRSRETKKARPSKKRKPKSDR